jgi:gamma-glutamyltranspeptidase / glutathione hydrolase
MQLEKYAPLKMVATPHPEAAVAAEQILHRGGNAVDAAVAAMMTLCVVMPGMVGLGGYGGSAVIHVGHRRRAVAVDFTAPAPLRITPELSSDRNRFEAGALSITVPTVLSGLDLLLRQFGTRSWADVSRHAADLAEHGFAVYPQLHDHMRQWQGRADPVSINALLGQDRAPAVGARLVQRDLARLIRSIAKTGIAAFYEGEVPRIICRQIEAAGGILCDEDFDQHRPVIVEPVAVSYRGHELLTPPPPSGGITTSAILKTLEQFDLAEMPRGGSEYLHLFAEVTKLCWRERHELLGDPDFFSVPVDRLLGEDAARQRARTIRNAKPLPTARTSDAPQHTANVVAADDAGNVISLTATQGMKFGSQLVIEGLGLVMNHGMSRFTFEPGSRNFPAPGKRMQHNMAPLLITCNGRPRFALGLPGGMRIVTVTAQLVVNLIDFGISPGEAIAAPRLHVDSDEPLLVTPDLPHTTIDDLKALGHQVQITDEVGGPANIVRINDDDSLMAASGAGETAIAAV